MSYKLRDELIKSIMSSLKIDSNPFNAVTIEEMIKHITDYELQSFYQKLFGAEHSFLNGIDRVAKVAESFKPSVAEDDTTQKAKELIDLVGAMNNSIYQEHIKSGISFDTLLDAVKFPKVSESDIAILEQVRPHYSLKQLISKINHYGTSLECLEAFKTAIKYSNKEGSDLIANSLKDLRIKG